MDGFDFKNEKTFSIQLQKVGALTVRLRVIGSVLSFLF